MVHELDLNNSQIGQINMWQTIGYAISGPLIAFRSDRTGKRKTYLIVAVLATSVFAALSAAAHSYSALLFLRTLVGASEGPILPLAMAMVAAVSSPGRFGRNAGIVNSGVAVIAGSVGPVLVTQLASMTDWRIAFLLVSVPSFLLALAFAPLYLTTVGKLSVEKMGFVMSTLGLITIMWAVVVPLLSDYFGRKPALIGFSLLGVAGPLALYLAPEWFGTLVIISLIGGIIGAIAPLFMNIIPVETVPAHLSATASAIIIGVGEIVGSFVLGIGGSLADSYGLPIVMLLAAIAPLLLALLSMALKETRPRKSEATEKLTLFRSTKKRLNKKDDYPPFIG